MSSFARRPDDIRRRAAGRNIKLAAGNDRAVRNAAVADFKTAAVAGSGSNHGRAGVNCGECVFQDQSADRIRGEDRICAILYEYVSAIFHDARHRASGVDGKIGCRSYIDHSGHNTFITDVQLTAGNKIDAIRRAAGSNIKIAVGIDRGAVRRAADDKHAAVPVKRRIIRNAVGRNIKTAAGIDRRAVRNAAGKHKHAAVGFDRRAVRNAAGRNIKTAAGTDCDFVRRAADDKHAAVEIDLRIIRNAAGKDFELAAGGNDRIKEPIAVHDRGGGSAQDQAGRHDGDIGNRTARDGFVSGEVLGEEEDRIVSGQRNAVDILGPHAVLTELVQCGFQFILVVRKNRGDDDRIRSRFRVADLNIRYGRCDGVDFAADGQGKRAVRQRQQVSRAADVSCSVELKRIERFVERILNRDHAVESRSACRKRIRACRLRAGDSEHIIRRPMDERKIVDSCLRSGRKSGNIDVDHRAGICGNDRAVREGHLAGQPAGIIDFQEAAVDRNVTCRAAFADIGRAAFVDRGRIRRAAFVDVGFAAFVDRGRVCRAAFADIGRAAFVDHGRVCRAAGRNVELSARC